jgi:hypothetical protein
MTAAGVRVGDRVKVERAMYEGYVEHFKRGHAGLGGDAEMCVRDDFGHAHYFDPNDDETTVTVVQPPFKAGQVWETPDGGHWFIRRGLPHDFCAMPVGSGIGKVTQTEFRAMLPRLIFPSTS